MITPSELDARLYGLLHRGTPGDMEHYVAACRGVDRILELGCGDGRIAVPLARRGARVTGIDLDPARLDAACRRLDESPITGDGRVDLVAADMSRFDLGRRFDRVLIPFNGIYCLADDTAVRSCLRCAHAHLVPGGSVWLDGYRVDPDDPPDEDNEPGPPEFLTEIVDGDRVIRVFESDRWSPCAQIIEATYRFVIQDPNGGSTRTQTIRHRYLTRDQLRAALTSAGFVDVRIRSGFPGTGGHGPWVADATR